MSWIATLNGTLKIPIVNDGTRPCPVRITATMTEAVSELKITLAETGEFILLTRALNIGNVVIIDTNARTITVNGADARADVSFTSTWFALPSGAFTVTADPASTGIFILYRERWI